jgi:hypothetical protein
MSIFSMQCYLNYTSFAPLHEARRCGWQPCPKGDNYCYPFFSLLMSRMTRTQEPFIQKNDTEKTLYRFSLPPFLPKYKNTKQASILEAMIIVQSTLRSPGTSGNANLAEICNTTLSSSVWIWIRHEFTGYPTLISSG